MALKRFAMIEPTDAGPLLRLLCGALVTCGCWSAPPADSPLDVVIALDNSGSMKVNDPGHLMVPAVGSFVSRLPAGCRVGLLVFDGSARVLMELKEASDADFREKLDTGLRAVDYSGRWTDIPGAVERAINELVSGGRKGARHAIILFTDGVVDVGNPYRDRERRAWLHGSLTAEAAREGIRVFGVAFTDAADFQLLQTVSQDTKGTEFLIRRPDQFARVFGQVADRLKTAWAADAAAAPAPVADGSAPGPARGEAGEAKRMIVLAGMLLSLGVVFWLIRLRFFRLPRPAVLVRVGPVPATIQFRNRVFRVGRRRIAGLRRVHLLLKDPSGREDGKIGRLHAEIRYRRGRFYLFDNHSKNGTYLSRGGPGDEADLYRLKPGEEVPLEREARVVFRNHEFVFDGDPPNRLVGGGDGGTESDVSASTLRTFCHYCLKGVPPERLAKWKKYNLCSECRVKVDEIEDPKVAEQECESNLRNRSTNRV
jgi:pSer/pThr/pTyr-binding forkhead associated (FHA) protein